MDPLLILVPLVSFVMVGAAIVVSGWTGHT